MSDRMWLDRLRSEIASEETVLTMLDQRPSKNPAHSYRQAVSGLAREFIAGRLSGLETALALMGGIVSWPPDDWNAVE